MHRPSKTPTNRKFGLFFASVFALISGYVAFIGFSVYQVFGWLIISAMVGLVSVSAPALLSPFNKAWMLLGDLMGKVISPLVLGMIFFVLITPLALITRIFGRDELRLKKPKINTYWIDRTPPGPTADSYKNQF